ncbi:MAG: App1 family protein [Verrucomicrobiota bacterium]
MSPLRAAVTMILAGGWTAAASVLFSPMISPVKADETVIFFTSAAWPAQDEPGMWQAEIHGIIFENEQSRLLGGILRKVLGLEEARLTPEESAILRRRLALFTVDCERGKALRIVLAGRTFDLPASGPNGHFRTTLRLPDSLMTGREELTFTAVLREGDTRQFGGKILPQPDDSLRPLVISDIDDTIKHSEVRDRAQLRMNIFCRPFLPVAEMAEVYRRWETRDGAQFHYVSGSPWQLYGPLEEFIRQENFPAGAWHLKPLRLKDPTTVRAFFGPQHEHKTAGIRALLERWPNRPVTLVGDTGEQDPEIYADLARRCPDRIRRIFLRNVTGESAADARFTEAFREVPAEKWRLFENAGQISALR